MRKPRWHVIRCLQGLSLLSLMIAPIAVVAQTPSEHGQIGMLLREWKKTDFLPESEVARLKPLGAQALPLLAAYLPDRELGAVAEQVMRRLDTNAATPYLLRNLPNREPSIQHDVFAFANRQMIEYDWYVRSGKPSADPERSLSHAQNTEPYPFRQEIHDAAVRALQTGRSSRADVEAIRTIGLTGDLHDVPLLQRYFGGEKPEWGEENAHAVAIAALARLGDKQAFDVLSADLRKPVGTQPAMPYWKNARVKVDPRPGAVVVSHREAMRLSYVTFEAGFTMDRRLVPLLLRHLDDPPGQSYGDYADPSPASLAMDALAQILYGKRTSEQVPRTLKEWKQWHREHAKEF